MNKLQSIITLIAIALAVLMYTGALNPHKKKYLAELKAQAEASKAREDSIKDVIFALESEALRLQNKADSTMKALDVEEDKRKKERDEFNRKMAQLGKLSNAELARYFAERYNRK
jgi:hypothetical protein